MIPEVKSKMFADCPNCTRPYIKTVKYPEEFCGTCESQGYYFGQEIEKESDSDGI